MSNAFKDWTPEMVAAHNARVTSASVKNHATPNPVPTPNQPQQPQPAVRDGSLPPLEIQEGRAARLFAIAQGIWSLHGTDPVLHRSHTQAPKDRYLILITDIRERLIDEDNLCEKYIVDCLRYCKEIPQDDPATCKIITTQLKAETPDEVGILIEIIKL